MSMEVPLTVGDLIDTVYNLAITVEDLASAVENLTYALSFSDATDSNGTYGGMPSGSNISEQRARRHAPLK